LSGDLWFLEVALAWLWANPKLLILHNFLALTVRWQLLILKGFLALANDSSAIKLFVFSSLIKSVALARKG
jgi:hypothetical protein